ncbi:MAG: NYN domain-containing protein, partial [Candidatus Humimicrobiaceae bacterium]
YIYLKDKYKVSKVFLFIGYVAGNEGLYTFLQKSGYIVVFKPTLEYRKKERIYTKGNVDGELILHAMIEYANYDKAIIVSGDGDFHCLVEYLEGQNKLLNIIIPNSRKYSALLRKYEKYFVYLNKLKKKLSLK